MLDRQRQSQAQTTNFSRTKSLREGVLIVQGAMRATLLRSQAIDAFRGAKKEEEEASSSASDKASESEDELPREPSQIAVIQEIERRLTSLPIVEQKRITCTLDGFRKALEEMFAHACESLSGIMDTSKFMLCSRAALDAGKALEEQLGSLPDINSLLSDTGKGLSEVMLSIRNARENPKAFVTEMESMLIEADAGEAKASEFDILKGKDIADVIMRAHGAKVSDLADGSRSSKLAGKRSSSSSSSSGKAEKERSSIAECPPEEPSSTPPLTEEEGFRRFAFLCEPVQEVTSPTDEASQLRDESQADNEADEPQELSEVVRQPSAGDSQAEVAPGSAEKPATAEETEVPQEFQAAREQMEQAEVNQRGSMERPLDFSEVLPLLEEDPDDEQGTPPGRVLLEAGSSEKSSREWVPKHRGDVPISSLSSTWCEDDPSNSASFSHTWAEWPTNWQSLHAPDEMRSTFSRHNPAEPGTTWSHHSPRQQEQDQMRKTWSHFDHLCSQWQLPRCNPSRSPRQKWVSALLPSVQQQISECAGDRVTLESVCLERMLVDQPGLGRYNQALHHAGVTMRRRAPHLPPISIEPLAKRQVLVEAAQSELDKMNNVRRPWHPYGRRPPAGDRVLFPLLGGHGRPQF